MLLPRTCASCGRVGESPCEACRAALLPAPPLPAPPGIARLAALTAHEGAGRAIVTRLKYRNARSVVPWLAAEMAALVGPGPVDAVTWVPTTGARRRARGFDQARLLAKAVARRLGVPCRRLLHRRSGPAQTGRSRADRLAGPVLDARGVVPPRVLLVDDVCTTGTTLASAAAALRSAGAHEVTAVVAARRPLRSRSAPARPMP